MLSVRLAPEWRVALKRHAEAARMTPHQFALVCLVGRLLRLDGAVSASPSPEAATAARVRALLDEAERAAAVGVPTVTLPTRDLCAVLHDVITTIEAPDRADS